MTIEAKPGVPGAKARATGAKARATGAKARAAEAKARAAEAKSGVATARPWASALKPRIAILGAGPIGLEAALAAAERGWEFTVYEMGDAVGANVRDWGHVRLFTPWEMN